METVSDPTTHVYDTSGAKKETVKNDPIEKSDGGTTTTSTLTTPNEDGEEDDDDQEDEDFLCRGNGVRGR